MRNALAIAHKELRAYFASPIAYIVIGFFALLFGWFYIGILDWFVRQGMQMGQFGMQGPQNMNVNQQMIRPLLLNMTVVFLFLLPLVTMRTYAEEKRSGTIELLLTSPLTDMQIVIGFFALLFGWFYIGILDWFVRQGMQMGPMGMGQSNMNVNQQMVRPLLLNMTVVFLFLLPLITMRTYAEEKRSGTIELLLTSPITDVEIVAGKFLGAMGLYASMLAVSLLHFGLLFAFGTPEWKPLVTSYVGLLLFGGCFVSVGLFISSLTKNQIVAGAATFGVFLLLWVIDWIGQGMGPRAEAVLKYLSMTEHLDDFVKGVVDTKHLVYYLSFITFGLFLTVKSVDSERWRG